MLELQQTCRFPHFFGHLLYQQLSFLLGQLFLLTRLCILRGNLQNIPNILLDGFR